MSILIAGIVVLFLTLPTHAAEMPSPDALTARMGTAPQVIRVHEPHLSVGGRKVAIEYLGYPAGEVLSKILGTDWRGRAGAVEFRALDGYVSRIDTARFGPGHAWLVFARRDGTVFTVDNLGQNQLGVPLGPYYLVWDNITRAELFAEGASHWPYQVVEISLFDGSDAALRPDGLDGDHGAAIDLVKTNCLSCHKVNGYGGEKFEDNLAALAKARNRADFLAWLLAPSRLKPGTTMPPLAPLRAEAERERMAGAIYEYLEAVPVVDPGS
ncbi:MAG: hypothetical protein OEN23_05965 [Paracoccaceae bacterium]|nr:hypothetical protein [Paracoccaceae bacterium]